MGGGQYNFHSRSLRSADLGYKTKAVTDIFVQQRENKINEGMNPKDLKNRECFDSVDHPNTLAVILGLDVTGSMGRIPHMLIQDGLPTLMAKIIEAGSPDAQLCFVPVGDHKADRAPLQVGQFESDDAKMDHWLTRSWLEGNGGGNHGESYPLVWYFAGNHTDIDCFNKRGEKGILVTVGDENLHTEYTSSQMREIFGTTCKVEGTATASDFLDQAKKKYHVYHIALPTSHPMGRWKELLGENLIEISDYTQIPKIVSEIVLKHTNGKRSEVIHNVVTKTDDDTIPSML